MKYDYFIALILIVLILFLIYRLYLKFGKIEEEPEQHDLIDCRDLQPNVEELHKMMQRLAELDDIIIELRLCKPAENMRSFRVEWQSISGTSHAVDFMADGESESHESFRMWAVNERIKLNQTIAQRIHDLYAKAAYIDLSPTSESDAGEWQEMQILYDGDRIDMKNSAGEWLNADTD